MAAKKEWAPEIVKKLDCTAGAGKAREIEYSELNSQQCKLKKKYRHGGNEYSKGGAGSSTSGNNTKKAPQGKRPEKTNGAPRVMVVNGGRGTKRMEILNEAN